MTTEPVHHPEPAEDLWPDMDDVVDGPVGPASIVNACSRFPHLSSAAEPSEDPYPGRGDRMTTAVSPDRRAA